MVKFKAVIRRFDKQGEKTGWTYFEIPVPISEKLNPGVRVSFRVRGKLDQFKISGVSLLPMGGGAFIMPLNAGMRKAIGKRKGAMLQVQLELDSKPYVLNKELLACLEDEPLARKNFMSMPGSFQRYYSKWIESAKTEETRTKRIAHAINSLAKHENFGEMLRSQRKNRDAGY